MKKTLVITLVILLLSAAFLFAYDGCGCLLGDKSDMTWQQVQNTMNVYIKSDMHIKGGKFIITDAATGKELKLDFEGLHKGVKFIEEEGAYYACADFRSQDKKTLYDIDFWVKQDRQGSFVDRVLLHKENGKARFSYDKYKLRKLEKKAPEDSVN